MVRKRTSPASKARSAKALQAKFDLARWKIWRARSKSEYTRRLGDIEAAAQAGIAEAWQVLFYVHRKAGRRKLARQCVQKVFETACSDDAIFVAQECIYRDQFGSRKEQRQRGFSPELGLTEILRRAHDGDEGAMYSLSRIYAFGGPIRRDERKAVLWLRRAAAAGDLDSITNLGVRYRYGEGVRKNAAKALRWYRAAAARGCFAAMYNIGLCHRNGTGVRKDEHEALRWFKRASKKGNASASVCVANAMIDGKLMRSDPRRGMRLLKQLASRNNLVALDSLGQRLIDGRGLPKDTRRGRRMLAKVRRIEREREGDYFWG
jgi:TPR repeat protein